MSGSDAGGNTRIKRGSNFSDGQVHHAVKDQRKVVIDVAGRMPVEGYFCGVDDYHWGVVNTRGEVSLVHKSAPIVKILSTTLEAETREAQERVNKVSRAFRERVLVDVFQMSPANH